MKPGGFPVWQVVVCAVALVVLGGCSGGAAGAPQTAAIEGVNEHWQGAIDSLKVSFATQASASSAIDDTAMPSVQKWEYDLGVMVYDAECAALALAPYKDHAGLKTAREIEGLASKEAIALVWKYGESELPAGAMGKILSEYLACGQSAFDAYIQPMGDQGWEMVSYNRLSYAEASVPYIPSLEVDYGYEVMWKRPK